MCLASADFVCFLVSSSFVLDAGNALALTDHHNIGTHSPMGGQLVGLMRTLLCHSAALPEKVL